MRDFLKDILETELIKHPNIMEYVHDAELEAEKIINVLFEQTPPTTDEIGKMTGDVEDPAKPTQQNLTAINDQELSPIWGVIFKGAEQNPHPVDLDTAYKEGLNNGDAFDKYLDKISETISQHHPKSELTQQKNESEDDYKKRLGEIVEKSRINTKDFKERQLSLLSSATPEKIKRVFDGWDLNFLTIFKNLKDSDFTKAVDSGEMKKTLLEMLNKDLTNNGKTDLVLKEKEIEELNKTHFDKLYDALVKTKPKLVPYEKEKTDQIETKEKSGGERTPKEIFTLVAKSKDGKQFFQKIHNYLKSHIKELDQGLIAAENAIGSGLNITPGKGGRNVKILAARKVTIMVVLVATLYEVLINLFSTAERREVFQRAHAERFGKVKMDEYIPDEILSEFYEDEDLDKEFFLYDEGVFNWAFTKIGGWIRLAKLRIMETTHFAGLYGVKDTEGNIDDNTLMKNYQQIFTADNVATKEIFNIIKASNVDLSLDEIGIDLQAAAEGKNEIKGRSKLKDDIGIRNGVSGLMRNAGGARKLSKGIMLKILGGLGVKQTTGAKIGSWLKEKKEQITGQTALNTHPEEQ